jgi:hypothetical protein
MGKREEGRKEGEEEGIREKEEESRGKIER